MEFETETSGAISVRIDRKRKIPATSILRAFGVGKDEEIKKLFADIDNNPEMQYIVPTIVADASSNEEEGLIEMYKRIRPGDPATLVADSARAMEKLVWQPKYTKIDDIIATAWHWHQNQRF